MKQLLEDNPELADEIEGKIKAEVYGIELEEEVEPTNEKELKVKKEKATEKA